GEVGTPTSAGGVVARTRTLCRSSGGKSGWAAAARAVSEALQAVPLEAPPPLRDGVGGAAQDGRDVVIAGPAGPGGTGEGDAGAGGEGGGRGGGVGQLAQLLFFVGREREDGGFASHGRGFLSQRRQRAGEQGRGQASGGERHACTRAFMLTRRCSETQD